MLRANRLAALAAGIFTLAGGVHVHLARMGTQQIQDYTFDEFVRDFSRSYQRGTPEWASREATFKRNIQEIVERRADATSWTVGITKFVDYHDHEFNMLLGYKGRRQRGQYGPAPSNMSASASLDLPAAYDATEGRPLTARVLDQGSCGSCWALAAVSTLEGVVEAGYPEILEEVTGKSPGRSGVVSAVTDALGMGFLTDALGALGSMLLRPPASARSRRSPAAPGGRSLQESGGLSVQEAVSCTRNPRHCGGTGGCMGATAELAYDMVRERGLVAATSWPSTSDFLGYTGSCLAGSAMSLKRGPRVHIGKYTVLEQNKLQPLKEALYTRGHPIAVSVDATRWNFYLDGIYSDVRRGGRGEFILNHAVTLTGYRDPPAGPAPGEASAQSRGDGMGFWRIKNSWGPDWGEAGFIRLEMKANEQEHCGWDTDTHVGLACDGDPDKAWVCGTCGVLYDSVYPEAITLK